MTKTQLLDWMVDNYPEFPRSKLNFIRIPSEEWCYLESLGSVAVVHTYTGDFISSEDFYTHRERYRLKSCGMSFHELLEDLKN